MAATAAEPLGPLDCARRLEGNFGARDAALRPRDPLLHGGLAHQEGARDLLDRETGNDAQRQGDLLHRRQIGMAADKEQPQHVVAIVGIVEPLGDVGFGIVEIGELGIIRAVVRFCCGGAHRRARRCVRRE